MTVEAPSKKRALKKARTPRTIGEVLGEAIENGSAGTTAVSEKPAKEKKARKERPERPKQKEFAGMERPKIQELDDAAYELRDVRTERQALTQQEVDLAQRIAGLMKEHKLKTYKLDDDNEVAIVPSEFKVKVRKIKVDKDPSKVKIKSEE
jgi:hypothetical protein